mgnify:CR=1 FL=1
MNMNYFSRMYIAFRLVLKCTEYHRNVISSKKVDVKNSFSVLLKWVHLHFKSFTSMTVIMHSCTEVHNYLNRLYNYSAIERVKSRSVSEHGALDMHDILLELLADSQHCPNCPLLLVYTFQLI